MNKKIFVVCTITSPKQFTQQFYRLYEEAINETYKEPGCISFTLTKDINLQGRFTARKNTVTTIQQWKSIQDLQEHLKKPYVQTVWEYEAKNGIKCDPKIHEKI